MTGKELDLLGLSVHHIANTFLEEIREAGFDAHSTIYDMEPFIRESSANTICPITGKMGSAYVHAQLEHGEGHVGKANIILSHIDGYSISDIIHTLIRYCSSNDLDTETTYVWICCLCVNRHRVVEREKRGETALWKCPPDCKSRRRS